MLFLLVLVTLLSLSLSLSNNLFTRGLVACMLSERYCYLFYCSTVTMLQNQKTDRCVNIAMGKAKSSRVRDHDKKG